MIPRLLNIQGIAGIAAALALLSLLLAQKLETRHWRKQSGQYEQLYRAEQGASAQTVASYRAATEAAEAGRVEVSMGVGLPGLDHGVGDGRALAVEDAAVQPERAFGALGHDAGAVLPGQADREERADGLRGGLGQAHASGVSRSTMSNA